MKGGAAKQIKQAQSGVSKEKGRFQNTGLMTKFIYFKVTSRNFIFFSKTQNNCSIYRKYCMMMSSKPAQTCTG
jgi:hypothetical protein